MVYPCDGHVDDVRMRKPVQTQAVVGRSGGRMPLVSEQVPLRTSGAYITVVVNPDLPAGYRVQPRGKDG